MRRAPSRLVMCPLCSCSLHESLIERHASTCTGEQQKQEGPEEKAIAPAQAQVKKQGKDYQGDQALAQEQPENPTRAEVLADERAKQAMVSTLMKRVHLQLAAGGCCFPPHALVRAVPCVTLDSAVAVLRRVGASATGKHLTLNSLLPHASKLQVAATAERGTAAAGGFVLALGDCGRPVHRPQSDQSTPTEGFAAYLPACLQTVLGDAAVADAEAALASHEMWDVHTFLINGVAQAGLRESFIVGSRKLPSQPDQLEPDLPNPASEPQGSYYESYGAGSKAKAVFEWGPGFDWLERLKEAAEAVCGVSFNVVLAHRYCPDKNHQLGFHSDDTADELYDEAGQVVASVSLGQDRSFDVQWRSTSGQQNKPLLRWHMKAGDMVVMAGSMQSRRGGAGWKHRVPQLPAQLVSCGGAPRYNLTFRRSIGRETFAKHKEQAGPSRKASRTHIKIIT